MTEEYQCDMAVIASFLEYSRFLYLQATNGGFSFAPWVTVINVMAGYDTQRQAHAHGRAPLHASELNHKVWISLD